MHLVATNLCVWFRVITMETIHELHEYFPGSHHDSTGTGEHHHSSGGGESEHHDGHQEHHLDHGEHGDGDDWTQWTGIDVALSHPSDNNGVHGSQNIALHT
jgi:hypothetical protein